MTESPELLAAPPRPARKWILWGGIGAVLILAAVVLILVLGNQPNMPYGSWTRIDPNDGMGLTVKQDGTLYDSNGHQYTYEIVNGNTFKLNSDILDDILTVEWTVDGNTLRMTAVGITEVYTRMSDD